MFKGGTGLCSHVQGRFGFVQVKGKCVFTWGSSGSLGSLGIIGAYRNHEGDQGHRGLLGVTGVIERHGLY